MPREGSPPARPHSPAGAALQPPESEDRVPGFLQRLSEQSSSRSPG